MKKLKLFILLINLSIAIGTGLAGCAGSGPQLHVDDPNDGTPTGQISPVQNPFSFQAGSTVTSQSENFTNQGNIGFAAAGINSEVVVSGNN